MALDRLKKLKKPIECVPVKKLTSGRVYKITKVKKVNVKYGDAILVELNGEQQTYLPGRFSDVLYSDTREFDDFIRASERGLLKMTCEGEDNKDIVFDDGE